MMSQHDIEVAKFMAEVWRLNDIRNKKLEEEKQNNMLIPTGITYGEYVKYMNKIGKTPLSYDSLWKMLTKNKFY